MLSNERVPAHRPTGAASFHSGADLGALSGTPILAGIAERVTDQMGTHCCTMVCSHVVVIASGRPFEPVTHRDQRIGHTIGLQPSEDMQPEPRPFAATVAGPNPEDVGFNKPTTSPSNQEPQPV